MPSIVNATTTAGVAVSGDNSGVLALQTNNGTTAVTITTGQNVGIGVTATTQKLWVNGNTCVPDDSVFGFHTNPSAGSISNYYSGNDASNYLRMFTGGSERMRIDSSGNVGIGTTTENAKLTIESNGGQMRLRNTTTRYRSDFSVGASGGLNINSYDDTGGVYTQVALDGNPLAFNISGSEKMRIDSSGNLLVGATSTVSSAQLYVTGSVADRFIRFNNSQPSAPFGVVITYSAAAPNDTGKSFLFCADNSATRADIRSNGGLANYSANNVNLSDAREKTNVELAGSYLDKICAIPVKTFNYIDQNREDDDGLTLGVIAQDVQAIAPELVTESDWGTEDNPKMRLSIYQTDLQYALMKCIQELNAKVEAQAAEIAALKGVA